MNSLGLLFMLLVKVLLRHLQLGSIALIYSLISTSFSWARGVGDELNTVANGDVTALL